MPNQLRVERPRRGYASIQAHRHGFYVRQCASSWEARAALSANGCTTQFPLEPGKINGCVVLSGPHTEPVTLGVARLGSSSTSVRPARNAASIASRVSCESTRSERYTAIERLGFQLLLERPAGEPCSECPRRIQRLNTFGRALTLHSAIRATHAGALFRSRLVCDVGPMLHSPLLVGMALHLGKPGDDAAHCVIEVAC